MRLPNQQSLVAAGLDHGMAREVLATLDDRLAAELKFYYMNDNHTFQPLYGDTLEAIVAAARKHLTTTGYTYGMLCAPILLSASGKDLRNRAFGSVHAHARGKDPEGLEYFDAECRKWLVAHREDADVMRLLKERSPLAMRRVNDSPEKNHG